MSASKLIKAGTAWLTDHLIEHWPAYIVLFVSGGGTAYVAKLTTWINAYGAIAWLLCGLTGALLGILVYGIFVWIRGQKINQDLARVTTERAGISPTLPSYEDQRIYLGEFFNPYYAPYKNKVFRRCQVWGPSMVYLQGVTFDHCVFKNVQIVVARDDHTLWGVTAFERPSFIDCEVSNVTLVMNRASYELLDLSARDFIPVINELPPRER